MNQQIEIIIQNNGQRIQVEQGSSLADIVARFPGLTTYTVLGALVNNSVEALSYRVYNPKVVRFFDITHNQGRNMYNASLSFLLYKAAFDCFPQARLQLEHAMWNGYYCTLDGLPADVSHQVAAAQIKARMRALQQQRLPFTTRTMLRTEAIELLRSQNIPQTIELIEGISTLYVNIRFLDTTAHYLAVPPVPTTDCLHCWDFRTFEAGFLLHFPDRDNPEVLSPFHDTPKLFNIFQEHHHWAELLQVPTVENLNKIVRAHQENHLIQIAEALHEKKYSLIADAIAARRDEVKMVLLAGPSSSGKTTSCRRLAVQLAVLGFDVQQISLDDYFLPRVQTPRQPNGDYDFEALEALNIPLLNEQLQQLFAGEKVAIPTYDFKTGKPYYSGKTLDMASAPKGQQTILLVEGIHALNPKLTASIPDSQKFLVYVSALTQIALDDQTLIHSSDNRMIRRIVRDNNFRGYTALDTISRWDSVRDGEMKHIYPYQENADMMFNSALLYELGLLRPYAEPLLKSVPENREEYAEAQRLLQFLQLFDPIASHYVPPTSILREFLGDSSFEY